ASADIAVAMFGPEWSMAPRFPSKPFEEQLVSLLKRNVRIIPVMVGDLEIGRWLDRIKDTDGLAGLLRIHASSITPRAIDVDTRLLGDALDRLLPSASLQRAVDPEDPQRGQWGGQSKTGTRMLSATVKPLSPDWFAV